MVETRRTTSRLGVAEPSGEHAGAGTAHLAEEGTVGHLTKAYVIVVAHNTAYACIAGTAIVQFLSRHGSIADDAFHLVPRTGLAAVADKTAHMLIPQHGTCLVDDNVLQLALSANRTEETYVLSVRSVARTVDLQVAHLMELSVKRTGKHAAVVAEHYVFATEVDIGRQLALDIHVAFHNHVAEPLQFLCRADGIETIGIGLYKLGVQLAAGGADISVPRMSGSLGSIVGEASGQCRVAAALGIYTVGRSGRGILVLTYLLPHAQHVGGISACNLICRDGRRAYVGIGAGPCIGIEVVANTTGNVTGI